MLCTFHAIWKPFKENIRPRLPKDRGGQSLSKMGRTYGETLLHSMTECYSFVYDEIVLLQSLCMTQSSCCVWRNRSLCHTKLYCFSCCVWRNIVVVYDKIAVIEYEGTAGLCMTKSAIVYDGIFTLCMTLRNCFVIVIVYDGTMALCMTKMFTPSYEIILVQSLCITEWQCCVWRTHALSVIQNHFASVFV